jgi:stress-induced morphogen
MSIKYRTKKPDAALKRIGEAFRPYIEAHAEAAIELYRQNNVSVRVRIVDPDFAGKGRAERAQQVWPLLDKLPDDVVADVSMLVLLTPEETKESLANFEFDHPTPSRI